MNENNLNPNGKPTNAAPAETGEQGNKTFTQEEVNRIVADRLNRERAKGEQELAARELRLTVKEKLLEKGMPIDLLDAINCADKETGEKSIEIIEKVFNDMRANQPKPVFRGFQPESSAAPTSEQIEAVAIRKAMGLQAE